MEKHSVSRLSYLFAHLDLLSSETFSFLIYFDLISSLLFSDSSHLCFSSVRIVGSLTSKLPSMRHSQKQDGFDPGCALVDQHLHTIVSMFCNVRPISLHILCEWVSNETLCSFNLLGCQHLRLKRAKGQACRGKVPNLAGDFFPGLFCFPSPASILPLSSHAACYLQHFGAGTFHFACYLQHFGAEPSMLHAICSILALVLFILHAICRIWAQEPSIYHAVCRICAQEPFSLRAICRIWELEPSMLLYLLLRLLLLCVLLCCLLL